jgi:TetR/AcrR family transcriptional regulator, regulator of autoinduction and epiphytic fitness
MTDEVKPRRRYDSRRRREQAAQTRQDILAAAGALFRERGYPGTSMTQIAAEAGVVVETVYRGFGSKRGLFRAVMEAVLAGGAARGDVPVEERPAIRAVIEEPDPRRQVALYVATQPGLHRRAGPLLRALRDGMASDSELRSVWDEMEAWRLAGQGRFVAMLAGKGALRAGLSVEEARDVVWTLCSLEVHDLLVVERGWTPERYQEWLATALTRVLLPDDRA